MTLIVDEVMLREPNLLVPGKKPVGPVKIDENHYIASYIEAAFVPRTGNRLRDLKGKYLSTIIDTAVGNANYITCPGVTEYDNRPASASAKTIIARVRVASTASTMCVASIRDGSAPYHQIHLLVNGWWNGAGANTNRAGSISAFAVREAPEYLSLIHI